MTSLCPSEYIQYFLLTVSFPSLAAISLHDWAGSSPMVPRGTAPRKIRNNNNNLFITLPVQETVLSLAFTFGIKKTLFDLFYSTQATKKLRFIFI